MGLAKILSILLYTTDQYLRLVLNHLINSNYEYMSESDLKKKFIRFDEIKYMLRRVEGCKYTRPRGRIEGRYSVSDHDKIYRRISELKLKEERSSFAYFNFLLALAVVILTVASIIIGIMTNNILVNSNVIDKQEYSSDVMFSYSDFDNQLYYAILDNKELNQTVFYNVTFCFTNKGGVDSGRLTIDVDMEPCCDNNIHYIDNVPGKSYVCSSFEFDERRGFLDVNRSVTAEFSSDNDDSINSYSFDLKNS